MVDRQVSTLGYAANASLKVGETPLLFEIPRRESPLDVDPLSYDQVIVAFSGGKDSLACLLHLLDIGVPKSRMELWHHEVDGREGSSLMDWPVTPTYCRRIADAFEIPIYFSWRMGGFEREMCRENALTAPVRFETPKGTGQTGGIRGKQSTRRKFPQVAADLKVRWCSAYLKVDVCSSALANQERFNGKKILIVTGERAQESACRARYEMFCQHRTTTNQRKVDQWRPVHSWGEEAIWEIIARYKVNPHPAYRLGWGRVSCAACIFGSANQWATLNQIAPEKVRVIAEYEEEFGVTIQRRESVRQQISRGVPYTGMNPADIEAALLNEFQEPVFLDVWKLPAGAYGEGAGPV